MILFGIWLMFGLPKCYTNAMITANFEGVSQERWGVEFHNGWICYKISRIPVPQLSQVER